MLSMYPACFYKEEDGYSVIFPDLNYLSTCGNTLEMAMSMAIDCLAGYLYSCKMEGEKVPAPSPLTNINAAAISVKISPDTPVEEYFTNMIAVDVDEYAKKHFEKSVKKTLTIPAWLNTAAIEHNINFSQVLQDALKKQLNIL